ncbi:hypothetical protein BC629DRAFT_380153 [Irpex lacteus]|nr:hypothetical protein BC629DRAFT_380153 [Irpex lacteus]
MRGVEEDLPGEAIGKSMPCGFCGHSNLTACQQLYITKHGRGQAKSNCPRAHDFQYKASLTSTTSTPSTNTPIICTIGGCGGEVGQNKTAVWKYNIPSTSAFTIPVTHVMASKKVLLRMIYCKQVG